MLRCHDSDHPLQYRRQNAVHLFDQRIQIFIKFLAQSDVVNKHIEAWTK